MGVQGSGKGTQAAMMAADLDLVQISVGDVLRWNVQNHTKLGAQVRRIMDAGELVGDDLVEQVVHTRLVQHDWNYGFILDGFPRNARQPPSSSRATTPTRSSTWTCPTRRCVVGCSRDASARAAGWTTT